MGTSGVEFVLETEKGINAHDSRCIITRPWTLAGMVLHTLLLVEYFFVLSNFSIHMYSPARQRSKTRE